MSSYGVKTEFKYFAAANGYKGFKSYFPTIFNPREYDKIFILKGGPGTGKSTIMKSIANELYDNGAKVESIHCSSDPQSLDGVIIDYNQKKQTLYQNHLLQSIISFPTLLFLFLVFLSYQKHYKFTTVPGESNL